MQDDDSWRDAFSANAGLFFDNTSAVSDYGPLLTGDICCVGMSSASASASADQAAATMPSPSPAPATHNMMDNSSARVPIPAMDFAALVGHQQQQPQQQRQRQPHQPPHVRVQIARRPTTTLLVAAAPAPAPPPVSAAEEPPFIMQSRPPPPPPPRSQQQGIAGPVLPMAAAPRGGRAAPVLNKPAAAATTLPAAARPATLEEPSPDQQGIIPNQRGGESFTRKRDRAKLLRQQMNDGLDNLHEALVEISTSGANPSASAATSLIPTRGPRRAAVVACSAELVRELISTCVALRTENASVSERLSAALAAAAVLQQQQQQQQGAGGGSLTSPLADLAGGGQPAAAAAAAARQKRDGGAARGKADGRGDVGEVSAKVFGQLLSLSVFGFLGPQSLKEGRKVSREWRDKCTWDCNWSNLCVSRWRLGPEERHAEVWRVPDKGTSNCVARPVVSPPVPPPSWRSIYSRLHRDLRVPTGALSPSHLVIGKSIQEGVAIWIALSRRSNGMTGRSVMGHGSAGFRTTEVIELRAVVQRVDEGPAVRVHPRAFAVRRVSGLRSYLSGSGSSFGSTGAGGVITTTGMFPSVSQGEDRFSPRFTVNTGAADSSSCSNSSCSSSSIATGLQINGDGGAGMGSWLGTAASPAAAQAATPPLALYEYATVDLFVEAAGCPTEADFLRLEACVDVAVSGAAAAGRAAAAAALAGDGEALLLQALSVGLTEATPPPPLTFGLLPMGVEMGRPLKRRF